MGLEHTGPVSTVTNHSVLVSLDKALDFRLSSEVAGMLGLDGCNNFLLDVRSRSISAMRKVTGIVPCIENAVPLISPTAVGRRKGRSVGRAATVPKEIIAKATTQLRNCIVSCR